MFVFALRDMIEYVIERVRYDTAQLFIVRHAFHGERLTGAGLAISEYGAVETFEYGRD